MRVARSLHFSVPEDTDMKTKTNVKAGYVDIKMKEVLITS
jgi:hypothetical protein